MILAAGVRLGSYEIRGLIGSGGMGDVYRARDVRLDRDVALKTLSDTWAAEGDGLGRFEREARILASLNHPNVAALYELFEAEGRRVLVMELVEGPTLADRLRSGRLSVDETLSVFLEIAAGLEAAHERGIVHRDLKPANIKTPQNGRAKILDFGIATTVPNANAEAADRALTGVSTTLGMTLTSDTKILGTPAYMSPEQARGHSVDRRTDIWAYGCCLYEALSGGPAFSAETVSDTVARVLKDEPDWSALPDPLPQTVRILLARCLRKDPRKRLRDIGDARIELEDLRSGARWTSERTVSHEIDFKAILFSRILNLSAVTQRVGLAASGRLVTRHDAIFREGLARYGGVERERRGDDFCATFDLPSEAVRCALVCQLGLARLDPSAPLAVAIGIHGAEIGHGVADEDVRGGSAGGSAVDTAARVAGLARGSQILLTGAASETARQEVTIAPDGSPVLWLDHGPYLFKDLATPLQILEAGIVGLSALSRPPDTETARRLPKPRLAVRPIYRPRKS